MFTVEDRMGKKLENGIAEALKTPANPDDLFSFAEYNPENAEKTGYSNYSYWGSTFRAFVKNRVAITLFVVLIVLIAFTFLQPLLPGQYDANLINNYPMSGLQVKNMSPSRNNVLKTAEEGTEFVYSDLKDNEDWYAVTNVVATIARRTDFTVTEYGEEWCAIEFKGTSGYVKNYNLKLPDDPLDTPYACKSNFNVSVFSSPVDFTNPDANSNGWVYLKKSDAELTENGTLVTVSEAPLRATPSEYGFLFGTNDIGQDLWARVWSGTRTSLYIGFMVALVEAFVGILVGIVWGYVRALDRLLTEVYNVLDNIPTTIVLILIAYIMSPSVTTLIFAMCLTRWMGMARFIRNQIIIIRDRDYNVASRCLGVGTGQIMLKNLLPYLVSVIMLRMALAIPGAIGNEVFITYIGLGVPIDTPSLGNLINVGRKLFTGAPALRYQLIFPTIVLSIITISFYIIGNAFADAADPRNHL